MSKNQMFFDDTAAEIDNTAIAKLREMLDSGHTTVSISNKLGVNRGLIPYVLRGNHSPTMLRALGLPVLQRRKVTACATCGRIHTMHRTCSDSKRVQVRFRKCADMHSAKDVSSLERIAHSNGFDTWTELCRHLVTLYDDKDIKTFILGVD